MPAEGYASGGSGAGATSDAGGAGGLTGWNMLGGGGGGDGGGGGVADGLTGWNMLGGGGGAGTEALPRAIGTEARARADPASPG